MTISKRMLMKWRKEALITKANLSDSSLIKYPFADKILILTQELIDLELLREFEKPIQVETSNIDLSPNGVEYQGSVKDKTGGMKCAD
jgi:hypothetical protein